jgi:hypothetical protein
MQRTSVLLVLLSTMLVMAWAGMPAVAANEGRSMPSGHMLPSLHSSAMSAIVAGRAPASNPGHTDWAGDVLIDTGYVADFAVDWNLADGTMWLAEAPMLDSLVKIYRSTDHGATWNYVFWFSTNPLSTVPRVGLVFGEGESSYVNVFFWSPAENGNVGIFRLKPDLSHWDAYWVAAGPDSITDFAVCRDYRNSYSLYCWAVVGDMGNTAPFLWSRDYGKSWIGNSWFNVLDPFLAPSAGPRINFACVNYARTFVTAGFNFNYGDSASWTYQIVNGDTFHVYRPRIAAANTEPDSIATRWVMYTKDFYNTGDLDAMYAVRSHAWADTWQIENSFRTSGAYSEGVGDIQHYKSIGNPYVNVSYDQFSRAAGDTSDVYWTWTNAMNPYGWATPIRVNDSATLVSYPLYASKLVYSPGVPATGGGVVYTRAGFFYIPHGLYFDAPWLANAEHEAASRPAAGQLRIVPTLTRGAVSIAPPSGTRLIRIFDASGRVVRSFPSPLSEFRWDGRNAAGERVSNGIYLIRAEGETGASTGRVIVTR